MSCTISEPKFTALNLDELKISAKTKIFSQRSAILCEGEIYNFFYIILSGSVKVFIRGKSGNELILGIYGQGDFLGELNVFEETHALTSATALHKTKVLQISKEELRKHALHDAQFACYLLRKTTAQIRVLTERLGDLALTDVYDRVTKILMRSATVSNDHFVINNPLSQQNIASMVGASQAMVSKIFKELSVGGYIQIDSNKITINKRLPKAW